MTKIISESYIIVSCMGTDVRGLTRGL